MPRVIEIATPLDEDVLLFHAMHAREELGRLSEYRLDLISLRKDIDPDELLGQSITVKLVMRDDSIRYFNGYVTRFGQMAGRYGKYYRYTAEAHPWLWFLTRTADCRIFQGKTVPDIVKEVFADHPGIAEFKSDLTEDYRPWTYCVQYRETDFNFVSRLLEHEGIYYYVRHSEDGHTLVLTDSKHSPADGYEKLQFIAPQQAVRPDTEHISSWEFSRRVQPGVYMHDDYDFERPSVDLRAARPLPRKHSLSDYEVFDYPGFYMQKPYGEQLARVRIDEYGSQFDAATAVTSYRGVEVGALFTLEGSEREDHNDKEFLIVSASFQLEYSDYEGMPGDRGSQYGCSFVAMLKDQQFRPKRLTPKPFVQGPQTAVVVGPAGDQIYTDKYGRVKVQFHWDRRGQKDANSSCWVRVSHPWAGKGWGSVATPRIGQEVIVDFLEGDPDQPIITGRVYNEENQPPFGFPAGAVVSGIKSDTHKGSGYNEISCNDTAGTEKITIHGQYDMNTTVEHDQTTTVHNNRTDVIDVDDSETVGNNQTWDVGVDRDATIGSNETLAVGVDRTKTVGANEVVSIGANQTVDIGSDRDETVGGSESLLVVLQRTHTVGVNETITVGAAQEITVGGMQAVTIGAIQTITVGASQTTDVGANQTNKIGANQTNTITASQTTKVDGDASTSVGGNENNGVVGLRKSEVGKDDTLDVGKNLIVTAGESISLTTGSATIVMHKDGTISIKGKDITLEGSGQITVKASKDVVVKGKKILQN